MSEFKQCKNGHYHQGEKCPYCKEETKTVFDDEPMYNPPRSAEKLTKEQIDKILAQLKELRKTPAYSGRLPYNYAMCYAMAMPTYFEWDEVPGCWICPSCGKKFGNGKSFESYPKCSWRDDYRDFTERDREIRGWESNEHCIKQSNFSSILNTWLNAKEFGYDTVLELHCENCIRDKKKPAMVFKFKFDNAKDYTISYPTESNIYKYSTVLSFLKGLNPNIELEDVAGALKHVFSGTSYEGVAWKDIFDILQDILGGTQNGGK